MSQVDTCALLLLTATSPFSRHRRLIGATAKLTGARGRIRVGPGYAAVGERLHPVMGADTHADLPRSFGQVPTPPFPHQTMSRIRIAIAAAAVMLSLSAVTATAQRLFADVTGKWTFTTETPNGSSNSIGTLKQDGEALTGTLEIDQMGTANLAGTVKGDTVRFTFTLDMGGQQMQIASTGVLKDKDSMSGQMELAGMGAFPFVGKRNP